MVCIYLHEKIKSNIILYNPLNGMQMSLETFVVCFIIFILLKKKKHCSHLFIEDSEKK